MILRIGQALVSLVLLIAVIVQAGEEIASRPMRNDVFSFSMPSTFTKTDARGIDSFVEEYVGNDAKLRFDFGWYSKNIGDWPQDK